MAFIITLPIAITSRSHSWFMRSSRASNPINANFSGFYHWRRGNGSSLDEAMYTEYNNTTIFYMHYANKPNLPVLNWQNDSVREHMFVSRLYSNVFSISCSNYTKKLRTA